MSILKVAQLFQRKLAEASSQTLSNLQKLMGQSSALASKYDYTNAEYDSVQNLAAKTYQVWNAAKKGLPSEELAQELKTLQRMVSQTSALVKDPNGRNALNSVMNIMNSIQPTDVEMPVASITPASKEEENEELTPEMQDVAWGLAHPKPLPWEAKGRVAQPSVITPPPAPADESEKKVTQPPVSWQYRPYKWK